MLKSNLKIAFRGYLRNKKFTVLILLSLISGLFVAYLGLSYIRFETGYESFHSNSDNIYRLIRTYRSQDYSVIGFPSWSDSSPTEQAIQVDGLKTTAGVQDLVQFYIAPASEFISAGDNQIPSAGILSTNTPAGFVSMFSWETRLGSLANFASGTKKIILTSTLADKIFGDGYERREALIGSEILVGENSYELAAIIADVPANSHFDFRLAVSTDQIDYWGSRVYIQKKSSADPANLQTQVNKAFASFNPRLAQDELYAGHYLQPITSIHLDSNVLYESKAPGNSYYISLIGFFTILILFISLFNYANLTLAIKSKEGKSIGVRKAMGARNRMIAFQFFLEGVLLSLLAIPFVGILVSLLAPGFNSLMGTTIATNILTDFGNLAGVIGLAVLIGVLASITPVIYLGMRKVVSLFKEDWKQPAFQTFPVRKYMIIGQLIILIGISSISLLVSNQLKFVSEKELGYKKDGILFAYTSEDKIDYFQQKLNQIPGVLAVGKGSSFGIQVFNQGTYQLEGVEEVFDDSNQLYLNQEAVKAYDLKTTLNEIPSGRFTLINRTAAERFATIKGVSAEELIGTQIITEPEYTDPETGISGFPFTIDGIFEDIHLFSLHERMDPYFLTISDRLVMNGRSIVSYDPNLEAEVLKAVEAVYAELKEPYPLEVEFLSSNLNSLYQQDRRTADLLLYFTIIAVFLAGLGIIGVTIFLTLAKRKEIGIRKVLGASAFSIVKASTTEYIIMVGIALIIAWPVAYWASDVWLSNFAYRIEISQLIFPFIGLAIFGFVIILVGFIAYGAAQENPVRSLKTE